MAIPEPVRQNLLSIVGDLRLFKKDWPHKLVLKLMVASNEVNKADDKELHDKILVTTLALFPKMPGEELPEGLTIDKLHEFAWLMLDDIYKKLGGIADVP